MNYGVEILVLQKEIDDYVSLMDQCDNIREKHRIARQIRKLKEKMDYIKFCV